MFKNRLRLCSGPILFCLLDGALTLFGQAGEYWAGNFKLAEEWNPVGRWALEQHPMIFATVLLCWLGTVSILILSLPVNLALVASFAIQLGHTVGAVSWVYRDFGSLACIPLLVVSRLVLDLTWEGRMDCSPSVGRREPIA